MSALVSRREALLSIASLLRASLLRAQQETTFSADVKVVNVLATVRDRQGQIIRNLTKDDFVLEENGRPQVIRYFSQETNLPLTLGLLVDTSGSQRRVLGQEKDASYRFLGQVLREDRDLAFVIHFEREVELLQDLTSSRRKLEASLDSLQAPGGGWRGRGPGSGGPSSGGGHGGTSLYDAVFLAADELMKKQAGRKAVIALTDGVDNASRVSLSGAIESAQRADTLVYSILFADAQGGFQTYGGFPGQRRGRRGYPPMQRTDGRKILQRLSRETGGGYFEVSSKMSIDQVFSRIEEELRNQYNIGYTPDSADAGYRKIHVSLKRQGLIAQTRDGYYAK
jgi:VWFA-related protein